MATLQDVIRRITIQSTAPGAEETAASLLKVATAQGSVAVATATTEKATLSMQTRINSLQKSLDAEYAADVKMASIEKTLAAARDQGVISAERENELLTLATAKYVEAGAGAELMARSMEVASEAGKGLLATLGPLAALTALAELPSKIIESTESVATIGETAESIDVTTKSLQELDYAAQQNGVSTETMNSALERFEKNLGTAATGSGQLAAILKANGVAITGDPMKDLENYANLIQNATSAEQRNYLTTTAFGKGAADLGRLFSDGAEGIKHFADEADNANVVLSDGTIETARELNDEFHSLESQLNVTFEEFMINIAPALEVALVGITKAVQAANAAVQAGKWAGNQISQMSMPLADRSDEFIQNDIKTMQTLIASAQSTLDGSHPTTQGFIAMGLGGGRIPGYQSQLAADQAEMVHRSQSSGADIASWAAGNSNKGWGTVPTPTISPDPAAAAAAQKLADEYNRVNDALNLQLKTLTETDRQKYIDDEMSKAHVTDLTTEGKNIEALAGKYYDEKVAIQAANDAANFLAQTTESAFEGLITGGESVVDVLGQIEKAIANAVIQAELLGSGPLAGILGTSPTTSGGVGGLLGTITSSIFHPGTTYSSPMAWAGLAPNAKGGVYASPSLSAYSNMIVREPTPFRFAAGAGIMGEAGPEAIMPLKRGADGRLGVAAANGNAPQFNLSIVTAPGQTADVTQKRNASGGIDAVAIIKSTMKTAFADGSMDQTMSVYGMKRVGR